MPPPLSLPPSEEAFDRNAAWAEDVGIAPPGMGRWAQMIEGMFGGGGMFVMGGGGWEGGWEDGGWDEEYDDEYAEASGFSEEEEEEEEEEAARRRKTARRRRRRTARRRRRRKTAGRTSALCALSPCNMTEACNRSVSSLFLSRSFLLYMLWRAAVLLLLPRDFSQPALTTIYLSHFTCKLYTWSEDWSWTNE